MDIRKQVVEEIARLNRVLALLDEGEETPKPTGEKIRRQDKRKLSASARRKIAAAQKARWAKWRAEKK